MCSCCGASGDDGAMGRRPSFDHWHRRSIVLADGDMLTWLVIDRTRAGVVRLLPPRQPGRYPCVRRDGAARRCPLSRRRARRPVDADVRPRPRRLRSRRVHKESTTGPKSATNRDSWSRTKYLVSGPIENVRPGRRGAYSQSRLQADSPSLNALTRANVLQATLHRGDGPQPCPSSVKPRRRDLRHINNCYVNAFTRCANRCWLRASAPQKPEMTQVHSRLPSSWTASLSLKGVMSKRLFKRLMARGLDPISAGELAGRELPAQGHRPTKCHRSTSRVHAMTETFVDRGLLAPRHVWEQVWGMSPETTRDAADRRTIDHELGNTGPTASIKGAPSVAGGLLEASSADPRSVAAKVGASRPSQSASGWPAARRKLRPSRGWMGPRWPVRMQSTQWWVRPPDPHRRQQVAVADKRSKQRLLSTSR